MKGKFNVAVALLAGALTASASDKPNADVTLTEIVSKGKEPISRPEILVTNLPMNLSLYMFMQHSGDNDVYRTIIQHMPISGNYKGIEYSAGLSAQHLDGTNFDAHQEAGLALSLSGKPTENTFVKSIARYYPSKKNIHSLIITDINGVKADILSSWDLGGEGGFVRYALNIPLTDNVAFRLEGQHDRKNGNLKSAYGGFGIQAKF